MVDVLLHRPALHPSFPMGLVKTESLDHLRVAKGEERFWLSQTLTVTLRAMG